MLLVIEAVVVHNASMLMQRLSKESNQNSTRLLGTSMNGGVGDGLRLRQWRWDAVV